MPQYPEHLLIKNILWILSIPLGQSKKQANSYMVQNVYKKRKLNGSSEGT